MARKGIVSKYRAVRTDGYASRKEAARAAELKILRDAGLITGYEEQRRFQLLPAAKELGFPRPLEYVSDFDYFDSDGNSVIEDVKGFQTPVYKLKKRLMAQLLGLHVTEV